MQYIFACTVHTYYIYSLQYIYSTYNTYIYIYIIYIYILGLRNETTNGWDDPCQRFPTMWQKVWSTWTSWGYLFKKTIIIYHVYIYSMGTKIFYLGKRKIIFQTTFVRGICSFPEGYIQIFQCSSRYPPISFAYDTLLMKKQPHAKAATCDPRRVTCSIVVLQSSPPGNVKDIQRHEKPLAPEIQHRYPNMMVLENVSPFKNGNLVCKHAWNSMSQCSTLHIEGFLQQNAYGLWYKVVNHSLFQYHIMLYHSHCKAQQRFISFTPWNWSLGVVLRIYRLSSASGGKKDCDVARLRMVRTPSTGCRALTFNSKATSWRCDWWHCRVQFFWHSFWDLFGVWGNEWDMTNGYKWTNNCDDGWWWRGGWLSVFPAEHLLYINPGGDLLLVGEAASQNLWFWGERFLTWCFMVWISHGHRGTWQLHNLHPTAWKTKKTTKHTPTRCPNDGHPRTWGYGHVMLISAEPLHVQFDHLPPATGWTCLVKD